MNLRTRGGGGQKIRKFCGRHKWMAPMDATQKSWSAKCPNRPPFKFKLSFVRGFRSSQKAASLPLPERRIVCFLFPVEERRGESGRRHGWRSEAAKKGARIAVPNRAWARKEGMRAPLRVASINSETFKKKECIQSNPLNSSPDNGSIRLLVQGRVT